MSDAETKQPCECATGLCEGTDPLSGIVGTENPPKKTSIRYRLGTHGTFNQAMQIDASADPSLRRHTSRDSSSAMLAFLDANAYMLDILCLYNQLIANEGYLPTAIERLSLLELSRSIGYELKPGVAASTYLAFDVQTAPGMPEEVYIKPGVQAQTIPLPDEDLPQLFETIETVEAYEAWNSFEPKRTRPQVWATGKQDVTVSGVSHNIPVESRLLVLYGEPTSADNWDLATIESVEEDFVLKLTKYTFKEPLNIPDWLNDIATFNETAYDQGLTKWPLPESYPQVHRFAAEATAYGSNAADWRMLPANSKKAAFGLEETVEIYTTFQEQWPNYVIHLPWEIESSHTDLHTTVPAETYDWIDMFVPVTSNTDPELDDVDQARDDRDAAKADFDNALNHYNNKVEDYQQALEAYNKYWEDRYAFRMAGIYGGPLGIIIADAVFVDQRGTGETELNNLNAAIAALDDAEEDLQPKADALADAEADLAQQLMELELAQEEDEAIRIALVQSMKYYKSYRSNTLCLDAEYKDVVEGSYIYLDAPEGQDVLKVTALETQVLASFGLNGKSSVLTFETPQKLAKFRKSIRGLSILAGSQTFELAEEVDPTTVDGNLVRLPLSIKELHTGRTISIEGIDQNTSEPVSQQLTVKTVQKSPDEEAWIVEFEETLDAAIQRNSAVIRGNLVQSTQGRSSVETIGHGDARERWASMQLSHNPLTYISSATDPRGIASSLEISVDGIRWAEVDSFFNSLPEDEIFTVRHADDGTTTVRFGDGVTGRRLPTGMNNVKATYRYELGSRGNLESGRLTNLMTRPLGLQAVHQPLPSMGGEDPEDRDSARDNAPLSIKTLGRLVSLGDYADFAKAFAGIAKAHSVWGRFETNQGILLTIAGINGAGVPEDSDLFKKLKNALELYRDPTVPFKILNFIQIEFVVEAKLHYDERYEEEPILAQATQMLTERFNFAKMKLGEDVASSAIISMLQGIDGVIGVDLDYLYPYQDSLQLELQSVTTTEAAVEVFDQIDRGSGIDQSILYQGGVSPIANLSLGQEVDEQTRLNINAHLRDVVDSETEHYYEYVSHPSLSDKLSSRTGYIDKDGNQFPAELLTLDVSRLAITAVPTEAYQL